MAKKILEDLIIPKKKSGGLTHGRPAERPTKPDEPEKPKHVSYERRLKESEPPAHVRRNTPLIPPLRPRLPNYPWRSLGIFFGALVVIIGGFFILSKFFNGVAIVVAPKEESAQVNTSFTAKKGAVSGPSFEIIMLKDTETATVPSTGSKRVDEKARGKIIVYNAYSSASQKLIRTTRFESSEGKIYRTASDVVVPGTSVKNGEVVPGSVEITIYADRPGPEYNIGLTDFTIPGFKGDPRYEKFYARSKTEMTGGFSGVKAVASERDIDEAKKKMERTLSEDLIRQALSQVPEGYILYKDATVISFDDIKSGESDSSEVTVRENGALIGVMFKKEPLVQEITKNISASNKDLPPFSVSDVTGLTFSFRNGTGKNLSETTESVSFALVGSVTVTLDVNPELLAVDLAGKPKKDFETVLSKYPEIGKAKIESWKPFWARSFPGSASISVSVRDF